MQASTVKQAIKIGAKVAQTGVEAERLRNHVTEAVTHTVEDTVNSAKRAVKHGQYVVEDLVDEATYSVKRHPLQAVGLTLGVGFVLGTMFGVALSRLKLTTRCCDTEKA